MSDSPILIPLDKPTAGACGVTWPKTHGISCESATVERESEVTVVFPSGRRWTSRSRLTFADQEEGIVSRIVITPLNDTVSFDVAVRSLNTAIDELGIRVNSRIREKLRVLQKERPEWSPFATETLSCEIESGIELFAEIKPATDTDRWFLSYRFYVGRFFRAKPAKEKQER